VSDDADEASRALWSDDQDPQPRPHKSTPNYIRPLSATAPNLSTPADVAWSNLAHRTTIGRWLDAWPAPPRLLVIEVTMLDGSNRDAVFDRRLYDYPGRQIVVAVSTGRTVYGGREVKVPAPAAPPIEAVVTVVVHGAEKLKPATRAAFGAVAKAAAKMVRDSKVAPAPIDYRAVVADLETKRAHVDAAIAGIRAVVKPVCSCGMCPERFGSLGDLFAHVKRVHP